MSAPAPSCRAGFRFLDKNLANDHIHLMSNFTRLGRNECRTRSESCDRGADLPYR